MNPITWPGERFIVAYLFLALILIAIGYVLWFIAGRSARAARINDLTDDPYRIAYLRGGASEALRVAIFNLVDRKLLTFESDRVRVKRHGAAEALRRNLDREIVKACKAEVRVVKLLSQPALLKAAEAYAQELGLVGLVSNGADRTLRVGYGLAAAGLLAGVAITKVLYAIGHGRLNVGFLIVASIVAVVWVLKVALKRRTYLGGRMLTNVCTLMKRMKDRADGMRSGGATNEALMLASAFGLYALPAYSFPLVEQMFPKPKPSGGDGGGSSDSGSSCSSGCGGGGGCGGCGS